MIWHSVPLMTAIDIAIIGIIGFSIIRIPRSPIFVIPNRQLSAQFIVIFGLCLIALFHLADLAIMFLLPIIMPWEQSKNLMTDFHLNFYWPIALIAVCCISLGSLAIIKFTFKMAENAANEAEALQASETRYRDLIDGSIQGIIIISRDWKPLFANSAAATIFGYDSPRELLALESTAALLAEEERNQIWERKEAHFKGRAVPTQFDFKGLCKDGSLIWLQNVARIVDWKGERAVQATIIDITEAKLAEETLRESQAQIKAIIDHAPATIYLKDTEGRFLMTNREAERRVGHSNKSICGKTSMDLHTKCSAESAKKHDLEVLRTGCAVELEEVHETGDGRTIFSTVKFPVFDAEGRITAVGGIEIDVTARKQAEEALRASEAKFRNLIEGSVQGIAILTPEWKPLFVNQATADIFGYDSPDEILAMDATDSLVATEDLGRIRGYQKARLEGRETPAHFTFKGVRKDGSLIWLHNVSRVVDWEGKLAFQATMIDITEAKLAEETLQSKEQELRLILDNVPASIAYIDTDERLCFMSQRYDSLNLPPKKMTGKKIKEVIGELAYEVAGKQLRRALAGETVKFANTLIGKDGQTIDIEIVYRPDFGPRDSVRGVFALVLDVTERKLAEVRLRQLQEELLHAARLSAMGELSSAIAHELSQPLTAVMNYVQACRRLVDANKSRVSDEISNLIVKAVEQTERAAATIQSLKNFVKSGKRIRSMTDINQSVLEAGALGLIGTAANGISVTENLSDDLPPLMIDKLQIQQVILNLMRNAVQAMADCEKRELTITTSANGGNEVTVEFRDTGPGLADSVADHLFEPFVTTKEDGMGIGLSISHSIIESHGGRLSARQAPDIGAIFSFTLPAPPADSVCHDA